MGQYDNLDDTILLALLNSQSAVPFLSLQHRPAINAELGRLVANVDRAAFRILDGRLIALRKRGLIEPAPKRAGWLLCPSLPVKDHQ